jgi:hypothetical protein
MNSSIDTTPKSPSGCRSFAGKGFGTVFFGIFLLAGLLFCAILIGEVAREIAVWRWTETPCTILSSGVEETDDDQHPYRPSVRYEYEIDGISYTGTRRTQSEIGNDSYDRARDLAARYAPGATATCRFDPNRPGYSVLERRLPWVALVVFFPLIFVAIGGIGLVATWKSSRSAAGPESTSISQKARGRGGQRLALILGSIFVVVGGSLFAYLFAIPAVRTGLAASWSGVPCTVIRSTVRSWSTDDGTSYRADVLYEYEAGGQVWRSNRFEFFPLGSGGYDGAREIVRRYPNRASASCRVDPGEPSNSVLDNAFRPRHLLGLLPLLFLIAGAALARFGSRGDRSPVESEGGARDSTPFPAGPRLLEPQLSPFAKLGGTLFFALFWNGIVSVFVWQAWKGWESGRPDWFLTVFLVPFVLVGIVSFVAVGYFVLALANPRPRVSLTPAEPRLGETLHLEWSFRGRAARLRNLRVVLEGREEATYRRGTDTHTDREVFATSTLVETRNDWEIPRGSAELDIPEDTMHSFEAAANKIIWEIKLTGGIVRWPDLDQSFPISIHPMKVEDL